MNPRQPEPQSGALPTELHPPCGLFFTLISGVCQYEAGRTCRLGRILRRMELTKTQRRWLAGKAQRIKPTVMIGKEGLSEGVTAQTVAELEAHELIKVRFVGHKEFILEIAPLLAKGTNAELVRTIGHVAIFYRPREDKDKREIVLPLKS